MIFLRLFLEFAKVGLFAVGGGLATIPFLQDMGARTGWFTNADLTTMIAVSESTPGPMGVNMATYVGFEAAGLPGAVLATLGLITPSIIIIIIIAGFLQKFRQSKTVDGVFRGLSVLVTVGGTAEHVFAVRWPAVILCAAVFVCMRYTPLKKLHPVAFIAAAAVIGAIFRF